jgi:two-component system, OmpR family, sensor histidine kinase VicK
LGKALNVLMVEDNLDDLELILQTLWRGGYDPVHQCVDNAAALRRALESQPWEVILSDYALPRFSGLEALRAVRETHRLDVPFILISGVIGEEAAVMMMKAGAQDFVRKDNLTRLSAAIERELGAAETRRKKRQADERLEFERQLLRQLMEGTPDAIYFKDLQHRYTHLNDSERLRLNVTCDEEVRGKTADGFLPPPQARSQRQEEERIFATGEPLIDRIEQHDQMDGEIRWLSTTKASIRDQSGKIVGLVGISRDVTEHKRHEQMKDEFVATVSHELRTPLTSIAGALGLLAGGVGGALPDSTLRLLKIAQGNCQRLVRLVNDILDIQKIETGNMAFDLQPLQVRELVEQAIEASRGFAETYGVSVRLANSAASGVVLADADRLTQVVTNLLSNAIKFSPRGAEVTVAIETDGPTVRISVRDHGPGIPDAYRESIFEKFVQVDATNTRLKGGTGLGLNIVKQIVERLKGEISFEAAPGGGTAFHLTLGALEPAVLASAERQRSTRRVAL